MKGRLDLHLFWGSHSPLASLSGAVLVILASGRLSHAIICGGALLWVYGLSALIFSAARPIMPMQGRMVILLFLSAFLSGIYMFLLGILNPLLIMGMSFFLVLVPPCCLGSRLFDEAESVHTGDLVSRAVLESLVLSFIILALALIREPLGMGALSFPGSAQGVIEIIKKEEGNSFIPIQIFSSSAGGLLLLGYAVSLYRYFRDRFGVREDSQ